LKFFPRDLAVPENLSKETAANRLATVYGNDGAAAIGMAEEVMASFDANEHEPKATQRFEYLRAGHCGECAHAMTATR
jgi:hypothetical protein